jgi:hypothetical protein
MRNIRANVGAVFIALTVTLAASAQTTIQPPNPSSIDNILLRVTAPTSQWELQPVVINGSEITVTFRGGGIFPSLAVYTVPLGRLPARTYSVTVIFEWTDGEDVRIESAPPFALVVSAGYFVPTLGPVALLGFAMALAVAGLFIIRR